MKYCICEHKEINHYTISSNYEYGNWECMHQHCACIKFNERISKSKKNLKEKTFYLTPNSRNGVTK